MKVITAKPLTMDEMIDITGKDALMNLNGFKCRYMMISEGQEIDVNLTYYDPDTRLAFGLREAKQPNKKYDYLAFRIY